jgi:hypothetical protein
VDILHILIKDGTIIDGMGTSRYQSDLLIKGDKKIKIENDLLDSGSKVLDD